MTFQLNTVSMGNLTYSINGTEVTKQVTRESLVLVDYRGNYTIGAHWLATACNSEAGDGDTVGPMNLVVNQNGSSMSMNWTFPSGAVCTHSGPYTQNGKLGAFSANYSCNNGDVGQLEMFELTNRVGMVSARVSGQSTNLGCAYAVTSPLSTPRCRPRSTDTAPRAQERQPALSVRSHGIRRRGRGRP